MAYNYGGNENAVEHISFTASPGETVAIIGPTGSGKSTVINLIPRLADVTQGSVTIDGRDVRDYNIEDLRKNIGFVPQKNVLFSGTIRSNLLMGDQGASEERLKRAADIAQASEFINEKPDGFDEPIAQGGTNVSGGQKQRLCIARALLKNPKILILDDSTSAVDTHTDSLIREAFKTEIPEVTKFIIAQRVLSIKDCDIILVMDDGKIIAKGTNDELMENSPVYREIYETQMGGGDFDEQ